MASRVRRRFWITLPFAVLLLLLGIALIFLTIASVLARSDYDAGQYRNAESAYSVQRTLTTYWPQTWKATFNEGTAQLGKDDHFAARRTLETALEQVPAGAPVEGGPDGAIDPNSPECMVRTNLSLAIEGQAIEAREAKNRAEAIGFYNEALDMIAPCTSDGESESDAEDESESEDQQDEQDQGDSGDSEDQDEQDQGDGDSEDQDQDQDQDQGDSDEQDQGDSGDSDQQDQDQSESDSQQDQIEQRQRQQRDDLREEEKSEGQGGENEDDGQGDQGDQGDSNGGGEDDGTEDDGSGGGGSQPTDPRLEELEERNREANEQGNTGSGGGFGGGQSW